MTARQFTGINEPLSRIMIHGLAWPIRKATASRSRKDDRFMTLNERRHYQVSSNQQHIYTQLTWSAVQKV
jgi:hypothetical protein